MSAVSLIALAKSVVKRRAQPLARYREVLAWQKRQCATILTITETVAALKHTHSLLGLRNVVL